MSYLKKYIQTFSTLFTEPRQVIDSFLQNNRSLFMHPFMFCLMGVFVVVLLNALFVDFSVSTTGIETETENRDLQQISEWIQIVSIRAATQFLPLTMFLTLIVSLSAGGMLFLKERTKGFYDHLIINSYATGASMIALPILIPVWGLSGESLADPFMNSTLPAMVVAGVILWIYRLYFYVNSFMDWLKVLSSYITGYVIYVMISGFAASIIAYILYVFERLSEITGG